MSLNQPPLPRKIGRRRLLLNTYMYVHFSLSLSLSVLPPPQFLKMSHYSQSCLLLEWTPPDIESVTGQGDMCPPLLGCRIYIDGELEGIVRKRERERERKRERRERGEREGERETEGRRLDRWN